MTVRAVLCYVFNGDKILLAKKNRGFGAGKINAPGGKLEEGEDIFSAARRELVEEVGINPINLRYQGILFFYFGLNKSKPDWIVYVLSIDRFTGNVKESDEVKPFWVNIKNIPFDDMWKDDKYWFPWLLNKRLFKGIFIFDENINRLLKASVVEVDEKELLKYDQ